MRNLVVFWMLVLVGCGGAQPSPDNIPVQRVELDPMLVRPGGAQGPGETIDVNDLFDRAYQNFSARNFEEAVADYEVIIKYFPESRFLLPSLYNAGLAYEKMERWEDAARVYRTIIGKFPGEDDAKDAYYRLARAHESLEEFEQVADLMTTVLLRADLTTFDRVEAHVRRANALSETGDLEEAADGYRTVLQINKEAPAQNRVAYDSHFIVQTYFGLGRIFHRQVDLIDLVLPPARMGDDLKVKAELFMRAQSSYIRALSYHHPRWSMAAGFMIGKLYEDFYTDILGAEIPNDLSAEAVAVYFEELRKQIRPLMIRAVQVYEKNISLSKRIGPKATGNEWVSDTQRHLHRLKSYLDDEVTQKRAERFVLAGRDLKQMWEPAPIASDWVGVARDSAEASVKKTP